MNNEDDMCPNPAELFGAEVNGTTVTAFEWSGSLWYQLGAVFGALELPGTYTCGLASKVGNQFYASGEFQKYKYTWYATVKGLSIYVDYLDKQQYRLSSNVDKETARTRHLLLTQWLSNVCGAPAEKDGLPTPGDKSVPGGGIGPGTLALDMAIYNRIRDNLLPRIPDLAASLSIADAVPLGQKLFAVIVTSVLYPERRIDRPDSDPAGIWQGKDSVSIADAVRRSMILV